MKNEKINLETFLNSMGIDMPSKGKILKMFYPHDDTFLFLDKEENPFTFIAEVDQRGDGSGYETYWVFQRKSDKKYFYYYSYDGRVEVWELVETNKEVRTQWEFECTY